MERNGGAGWRLWNCPLQAKQAMCDESLSISPPLSCPLARSSLSVHAISSRVRNPTPPQRCTKPPISRNKSGISGLSGLWAQKSGTVPKIRNIVVSVWKKSGMGRNRSKMRQKHVFHFNLWGIRLFARSVFREAGLSNGPSICLKPWQLYFE